MAKEIELPQTTNTFQRFKAIADEFMKKNNCQILFTIVYADKADNGQGGTKDVIQIMQSCYLSDEFIPPALQLFIQETEARKKRVDADKQKQIDELNKSVDDSKKIIT